MLHSITSKFSQVLSIALFSMLPMSLCAFSQPSQPARNVNYRVDEPTIFMENKPEAPKYLALGTWGATGRVLTVNESSVSIDLPCANANFTGRPKLNKKGEFDAAGRYNPEGPGALAIEPGKPEPRPRKEASPSHNARFHGKVTGKKLELTITLLESNEKLVFSLEHGKTGRIFKCM